MSHAVSLVNTFAAAWADALVRTCWQGGLVILLVWAACRLWPALPPVSRCWLWRLAYAKLLLGLVWLPPLALPLLPRPVATPAPPARAIVVQAPPVDPSPVLAGALPPVPMAAAPPPDVMPPAPLPVIVPAPSPPTPLVLPTLRALLLTAWLLGVLASLTRVASAWRRALMLSRASTPISDDALHADAAELCRRLGLRRVPPLRAVVGIPSPLLLGLGGPAVLLPAFVLSGSPRADVKLMLAHELAHLARRDLLWDVLPQLAQRLFFFHPLVWLAGSEWALAQEIACDALAVQATGAPPSAYGRMLLGIATRRRTTPTSLFPTLAVGPRRHTLRRRLFAMQHIGTISRSKLILAAALTTTFAVAGLLPWRVVAQAGVPVSIPPAATSKEELWQEKQRAEFAAENAKYDAQFAQVYGHIPPARQKELQALIAPETVQVVKYQKALQGAEQERAEYLAAHPRRLSNAQAADMNRLLDMYVRRDGLNQKITWGNLHETKLLAEVAAAHDATSRKAYRARIAAIDQQRLSLGLEIRLLESFISRQKVVVALIPEDQRALMTKLRHCDMEIFSSGTAALLYNQTRTVMLREMLLHRPFVQSRSAALKASLPRPQARTASYGTADRSGPLPLRLAQSVRDTTVSPVMAEALDKEIARREQQQRLWQRDGNRLAAILGQVPSDRHATPKEHTAARLNLASKKQRVDAWLSQEKPVTAYLKARRAGEAWAQAPIASPEFSPELSGQKVEDLRRLEQQAQSSEPTARKYVHLLVFMLSVQQQRRHPHPSGAAHASAAAYEAADSGEPPPPPVPVVTSQKKTVQEKVADFFTVRRERLDATNAQLDAETAQFLKRLSPAQRGKAQAQLDLINADYAAKRGRIQVIEKQRADYLALHPYKASDAQYMSLSGLISLKRGRNNMKSDLAWHQIVKEKLLAHLASATDSASKRGHRAQIAVIDRERRAAEKQMRAQEPLLSHYKAAVAAIPEDQRTAMVQQNRYDRMLLLNNEMVAMNKRFRIELLRRGLMGKSPRPKATGP